MLVAKLTTQKLFQYVQSTLKLLGVHIDDQLTFSKHIGEVCKKASGQVGVLMPMSAKLQLCKSAILPQLSYYHTVWYFFQASDKLKLELTQERPLSAVFINRSDSYEQLIHRANLHTLNNRRLQDIAILMYKVKHNWLEALQVLSSAVPRKLDRLKCVHLTDLHSKTPSRIINNLLQGKLCNTAVFVLVKFIFSRLRGWKK